MLNNLIEKISDWSGSNADAIILTKWNRHKFFIWLQYAGIGASILGLAGQVIFSKIGVTDDPDGLEAIKRLNDSIV